MNQPILEVQNLSVTLTSQGHLLYPVQDITFSVCEEESVGIVGESGCGKSLSTQAILQLIPSPPLQSIQGTIHLEGEEILSKSLKELTYLRGRKIGMVFQDPMSALNPTLTIGYQICEPLRYHLKLPYKEAKERALILLEKVGIPDPAHRYNQYPHEFSGGMRQRVLIAIALALHPKILIADEPTTALDVTIQAQILELLRQLQKKEKMSILIITHDLGVVSSLCDRILIMYGGKIVEEGSSLDVLSSPFHPYTQLLLQSLPSLHAKQEARLPTIEGKPPLLYSLFHSCPFAPRCPFVMKICAIKSPPFYEQEGHKSACWLHQKKS